MVDVHTAHAPRSPSWMIVERGLERGILESVAGSAHLHVLVGPAGIGKSELAKRIATGTSAGAFIHVTALAERTSIPLGALEEFAPGPGEAEVTDLVTSMGARATGRVIVVDDAPRLDNASAEVIRRLVLGYGLLVIATARTGEALPGPLDSLEPTALTVHPLGGLSVDEAAQMLEARFRVPVRDPDVRRLVWETAGNPLHLRVAVDAAIDAGRVIHRGHEVEIVDSGVVAPLEDALAGLVDSLAEHDVQLLDLVIQVQPVARELLGRDRVSSIETLMQRGLLVADESGRLRVSHPLVAETISRTVGIDRARTRDDAITVLRAHGTAAQRFAAVQLERAAGRSTPADELLWAASYAATRGEYRSAAALADAASATPSPRGAEFTAQLATATYHSQSGELDQAEAAFARASTLAATGPERAMLASALGEHLAFRRGAADQAVRQAALVRAELTDPEAVALDAHLWRWRVLAEQQDADAASAAIAEAIAATVAATMRGEPAAALHASAPLHLPGDLLGDLADPARIAVGIQRLVEVRATSTAAAAADYLEVARAQAGDEVGFFTTMLASQRISEGRLADARRLSDLAIEQLRRSDAGELLPLALAVRATVSAQTGELADARARLAELDRGAVSGAAVLQRAECRASILAADQHREAAAHEIITVVTEALASGYRFFGALTLSEALRFGDVHRTLDILEPLADDLREPVEPIEALLELARAIARARPGRVLEAAQRAATAGLVTVAVEAIATALETPMSEPIRRRLRASMGSLTAEVDAPMLQRHDAPRLTPRERKVALAAAGRLRSREIAEQLGVTHRTVENQLYAVYRKLGVSSRDELREALDSGVLGSSLL